MLTGISFQNFRAVEKAHLDLGPLNLLVGPNGSGKSTVLEAVRYLARSWPSESREFVTIGRELELVSVAYDFPLETDTATWAYELKVGSSPSPRELLNGQPARDRGDIYREVARLGSGTRHYAFDAAKMREPVLITAHRKLETDGANLSGFLDYIRDNGTESFEALTEALHRCAPGFDDIGFDGAEQGKKVFKLRRTGTRSHVPARHLSEGTLYTVALLAMLYQPELPTILCLEEPDRGIHPRLYREIRDTLYRLAYPQEFGDSRTPVQVIATTHSPYFLNEFSDHPEQITVCDKGPDHRVTFRNLAKDEKARDILSDSLVGDAWVTGALGGVPQRA